MRMRAVLVVGLVAVATVSACSSGRCTDADRQPQELTRPDVAAVKDDAANLSVDLSGALAEATRVTATFDDELALDVEVPAASAGCAPDAVARYGYRVDPGPVAVVVRTRDAEERVAVTVRNSPRWVVVSLQDGFPLEATVWDERPAYG